MPSLKQIVEPIRFESDQLQLIDQLKLPSDVNWVPINTVEKGADAIRDMVVRGAPAIGVTAAYSYALAFKSEDPSDARLKYVRDTLLNTRPTAVNLAWAIDRMESKVTAYLKSDGMFYQYLLDEAKLIHEEDRQMNRKIGAHALNLIEKGSRALTHCNAGSLATGGYGTATGVLYSAWEADLLEHVWVDETRPFLQGARLTAFELDRAGLNYTLICDNMAASIMARKEIDFVVVGSDRIVSNGDVANKIGTYALAVMCHFHGIPFYVAAPSSTLDFSLENGSQIPIEERRRTELGEFNGRSIAINQQKIFNPGFDVTPANLVSAIITEQGIHRFPYTKSLESLK
ncbi:MAG: S-methyl-5-thioribose-1-phosphate isomerase [bacterium]|nr:S-methyl-5-thioribose-1-phosphate isomerase [bacterium]